MMSHVFRHGRLPAPTDLRDGGDEPDESA